MYYLEPGYNKRGFKTIDSARKSATVYLQKHPEEIGGLSITNAGSYVGRVYMTNDYLPFSRFAFESERSGKTYAIYKDGSLYKNL